MSVVARKNFDEGERLGEARGRDRAAVEALSVLEDRIDELEATVRGLCSAFEAHLGFPKVDESYDLQQLRRIMDVCMCSSCLPTERNDERE